ncbi:recombination-associated protein RdgC [Halomonas lysinitropha]|uniref:Recombination-associated protein RdgC n=1 Tax=Halomonas lysinitropha TaxID=2607506 RepID=A0A5K1I4C5_9GAMM|nr:recombination-associated protein RdgC [Halomonas lysinitropha]VVZ96464.1 Recombination-associated protein RdgC [Halomonas lysinitropha]
MWFRNLNLYRLHDAPQLDAAALGQVLGEQAFRPLGGSEARRMGWTPPAGRAGTQLFHELQGHLLLTAQRQERILPASVVREEVDERAEAIETSEGRKLRRQERLTLKEQVFEELLPRAFVRSQRVDLWWDTKRQLTGVNASSRKRAEEVLDLLRETLGSLKVTPLATQTLPMRAMTEWLGNASSRPADLIIGDQVELKAKGDDGVVRGRQVDLDSDEMQQLLESGRQASKLALQLEDRFTFVLHDDLAIKSIRFDDRLIDEASQADDGDDAIIRLETDFLLMAQALGDNIDRLLEWMGGEAGQPAASPNPGSF